jgi:antitoxin component YwqK of YwqJK toxin-antitoxin module
MIKKTTILLSFLVCIASIATAQGKKKIKERNVHQVVVYKYDYKSGKEKKTLESETTYDDNGNVTEKKEYDNEGKLKEHVKRTYDENSNVLKEITYNTNGKVEKTEEYKYNGELITEKSTYDANGKLKSKKTYSYK